MLLENYDSKDASLKSTIKENKDLKMGVQYGTFKTDNPSKYSKNNKTSRTAIKLRRGNLSLSAYPWRQYCLPHCRAVLIDAQLSIPTIPDAPGVGSTVALKYQYHDWPFNYFGEKADARIQGRPTQIIVILTC